MYCRGCGKEISDDAQICMGCGVPVGKGRGFCPKCGKATNSEAVFCVNCGESLVKQEEQLIPDNAKSGMVAGLLGIFLGCLGIHNFYLGHRGKAVTQLLLSIFGILSFVGYSVALVSFIIDFDVVGVFLATLILIVGVLCISVSAIWSFVESIILLCGGKKTDGNGKPLKN